VRKLIVYRTLRIPKKSTACFKEKLAILIQNFREKLISAAPPEPVGREATEP
jgi:hypothetical protein